MALGQLLLAVPLLAGCPKAEPTHLPATPASSASETPAVAPAVEREGWLIRAPLEPPARCPEPSTAPLDVWCRPLPPGAIARIGAPEPPHGDRLESAAGDRAASRQPILSVAASSDGEWVATADRTEVSLWQLRSGRPLFRMTRTSEGGRAHPIAFVPGSRSLLIAADCALHQHDLAVGVARPPMAFTPIAKDDAASGGARATSGPEEQACDEPAGIAVASDGDQVAVTTFGGLLRRFRISTSTELRPIRVADDDGLAFYHQPARPLFTGDGALLVVSPRGGWGPLLVLRAEDGAAHAQVLTGAETLADFDAAPSGTELALLTDERIAVVDAQTGAVLRSQPLAQEIPNGFAAIRYDPAGQRLLVISDEGLAAFDTATLRPLGTIAREVDEGVDRLVAFAPGGLWVHPEKAVRPTALLVRELPAVARPSGSAMP